MIIGISSIISDHSGVKKDLSAKLYRYFKSKHFKELNATGNICLETSSAYKEECLSLDDYIKINPQNQIVTLRYTYDFYLEDDVTFFRFYLNEQSIDKEKFNDSIHLNMNSIRFAYPVIIDNEIKMIHIIADPIYLDLKNRINIGV